MGDGRPARVPAEPSAARRDRESHHAGLGEAESRLVASLRATGRCAPDFFATVSHELRTFRTTRQPVNLDHGGELAVHSQEGRGTTVTVRIPLLAASAAGETAHAGGQLPPGSPPAGGGPPGAGPGQHTG